MLNTFAISGVLIVVTCTIMAITMLFRASSRLHIVWGIFCITVMLWGLGAYNIGISNDSIKSLLWWKIAYIGVIFIPIMFTHFVHIFLKKGGAFFISFLYLSGFIYLFSNLFTPYFINEVHLMFGKIYFLTPTPLYNSFFTLFILLVIYSHIILFFAYKKSIGLQRRQIQYFFIGSFLGFFGGSFSFLPEYNINIYPFMNLTVSFYPVIMGYAILRYQLMDLRVITTQLLIASLWVFIFVRTLLEPFGSQEQIIDSFLLILSIIIGILLIKSVIKEIKSREEIERLAKDLSAANERLKELDKLKSEFVSIASHQLRSPLTSIKGYASLVLDGSFGKVSAGVKDAIDKIFQSSQSLVVMIEDFLNISRIEQGRMKFEFAKVDFKKITAEVISELKPTAEKAGLAITFSTDHREPYIINADLGKIRQVITNLLDNSIKYTPKGSISVTLSKKPYPGKILLAVSDTGVGIDSATLPVLFSKFSRSKEANKVNVVGTGLGLYIAKEIVSGHHGRVWAESEGKGKGSTFYVEFDEDVAALHVARVADFAQTM